MFLGFRKQKHLVLIFLKLGFFNKHSLETIFKIVCYRVFYFFFFFLNVSYHLIREKIVVIVFALEKV